MKSITQFIQESSQNNQIKNIIKDIDSYNEKGQRAKNEVAEGWMILLKKEFEKLGAKETSKVPGVEELKEGTWLIYSDNSMVLAHWDYNHFITWTIQAYENGTNGKAVVNGSIYRNSVELDDFLISQMGGGKLTCLFIDRNDLI